MKILFLAHRIPYPPDKGDKTRAFHIIKRLSEKHAIYLVSLYDDKNDSRYIPGIGKYCEESHIFYLNPFTAKIRGLSYLLENRPASLGYFYLKKVKDKVRELLSAEKFDAIFVYSSSMGQYVDGVKGIKKIIDFVDCDSAKWKQYGRFKRFPSGLLYSREGALLRKWEMHAAREFDRSIVSTQPEKQEFSVFMAAQDFTVMPNGVDTEHFTPGETSQPEKLVFTGDMGYFANIDGVIYFCREILPLIRRSVPGVEFYIAGRNPSKEVIQLGETEGVFVTGFVEDIRVHLKSASAAVVPLRIAQGVQNKILEAMASGLPVISTSKALSGLDARDGREILVADTPDTFASTVVRLLEDSALRKEIGTAARRHVQDHHSWQNNLSVLDDIVASGA
jgi:polysaccharide biosynthesis protein PslH